MRLNPIFVLHPCHQPDSRTEPHICTSCWTTYTLDSRAEPVFILHPFQLARLNPVFILHPCQVVRLNPIFVLHPCHQPDSRAEPHICTLLLFHSYPSPAIWPVIRMKYKYALFQIRRLRSSQALIVSIWLDVSSPAAGCSASSCRHAFCPGQEEVPRSPSDISIRQFGQNHPNALCSLRCCASARSTRLISVKRTSQSRSLQHLAETLLFQRD